MKKTKKLKQRLFTLSLAALLPLSASTVLFSLNENATQAVALKYQTSVKKDVSLTNNNFNSSSSSMSLSTSLSGWTGQMNDRKTTAGIISVGTSFAGNASPYFHLVNNPGKSGTDDHILMINSKTDNSNNFTMAKQGYRSSSISLSANSYYSFQVSFKTDKNYDTEKEYIEFGKIGEDIAGDENGDYYISANSFESVPFDVNEDAEVYVSFQDPNRDTFYLKKSLTKAVSTPIDASTEIEAFYDDNVFIGFLQDEKPYYVLKTQATATNPEQSDKKYTINEDATLYECSIEYTKSSTNPYKIKKNTVFYKQKDRFVPVNAQTNGSIYLDGLTDENGNPVKAEYVAVSSDQWTTFYFFVATGNQSQSVNLQLWLGSKAITSSGVVFFDDVNIFQYSENEFWKTYQECYDKYYTLQSSTDIKKQFCTSLYDLRKQTEKDTTYSSYNLDFEDGVYNSDVSSLKEWKKDQATSGQAQVFDVNAPEVFKTRTGYDFVGSNYSYDVEISDEGLDNTGIPRLKVVAEKENRYVLGLWTNNNTVKVTSKDILIESKKVYKISAKFKISSLDGNAYMFIKENDSIVKSYNLSDEQYSIKDETASSGINSNPDNDFVNDYGTIEFYIKGGTYIDSSINVSLGLGNGDEVSTGCVVFDDVKIESATSEQYNSATNKLELGTTPSTSLSVPNGNFDIVTTDTNSTGIFTPTEWTITSSDQFVFSGVVSTDAKQFERYNTMYKENKDKGITPANNPYYWSSFGNPTNRFNAQEPDNILMLGNMNKSWQKLRSADLSIAAKTSYKLSFFYKTIGLSTESKFKVSLVGHDGFKLYESGMLSSQEWTQKAIYISDASGATTLHLEIEFGTETDGVSGIAYFDNFALTSGSTATKGQDVVDLSNFFLNIPGNNITSSLETSTTPAYNGSVTNSDGTEIKGGIVTGEAFKPGSVYYVENSESDKFFYITIHGKGIYVIQSNFSMDLESGKYYDLSFKLKTHFNSKNQLDKDKSYSYGVTFGLTGFKYMTELKSNDDYQNYHIYFNPSEATSAELYMALVCDSPETAGSMALYDLQLNESTEDEFNRAKEETRNKNYNVNEGLKFVSSANDVEENPDDTEPEPNTNAPSNDFNWLLIPTLITALAIVIAVVGYFLRKIKIKKIEIKRKESYDRKRSANVDIIKRQALAERDAQVQSVEATKAKFEKELEKLESAHKQKVLELREKDKDKVSKETDKEFKLFAKKRTVIAEKIESLEKEIAELKTPEHLLNLERKVFAEEQNKRKELQKISKQTNKKDKTNKDDKKEDA